MSTNRGEVHIDTIRSGCGAWFEPARIRRRARAEADAALIQAQAEQKVQDIAWRASERRRKLEVRRQKNIEAIGDKAVEIAEALPGPASKAPVDEDWVCNFFEQCQDVSNEEMQSLWAKLLAGEVARPGSFSLRTLAVVKQLRPQEAEAFTRFCSCLWLFGGTTPESVYLSAENSTVAQAIGVSTQSLMNLQSVGLLQYSRTGYRLESGESPSRVVYFGRTFESAGLLKTGEVLFSTVGQELAPLSGAEPNEKYLEAVIEWWKVSGTRLTEVKARPDPSKPTENGT